MAAGAAVVATLLLGCSGGHAANGADDGVTADCAFMIAAEEAPPDDYRSMGEVVAVPAENTPLQVGPRRSANQAYRFAKVGLLIANRADVTISITPRSDRGAYFDYGASDERGQPGVGRSVRFPGCVDEARWLVFAGGVWVPTDVGCVSFVVESGASRHHAKLGSQVACQ